MRLQKRNIYSVKICFIVYIGSRTWPLATPAPRCSCSYAQRNSVSRTDPRAMATVLFLFCFFEMLVFVLCATDRHTLLAAHRNAGRTAPRMRMLCACWRLRHTVALARAPILVNIISMLLGIFQQPLYEIMDALLIFFEICARHVFSQFRHQFLCLLD